MAMGIVAAPPYAACGSPATRVELVAPGQVPAEWEQWKAERRQAFEKYRDQGTYCRPVVVGCVKSGGQAVSVGAQQVLEGEPAGNVP
jgi:hypothetical protein